MREPPRPARRPAVVALAAALLALPAAATAQQPAAAPPADSAVLRPPPSDPRLTPGRRIRVTLRSPAGLRLSGRIDSVVARGFVLDTAERRGVLFLAPAPELLPPYRIARVPYEDIERLEVSRGTSRRRGAIIGALIGAGVGGALTGLNSTPQRNPTGGDVLKAATGGLLAGGLLGGVVGYSFGRERWSLFPWP